MDLLGIFKDTSYQALQCIRNLSRVEFKIVFRQKRYLLFAYNFSLLKSHSILKAFSESYQKDKSKNKTNALFYSLKKTKIEWVLRQCGELCKNQKVQEISLKTKEQNMLQFKTDSSGLGKTAHFQPPSQILYFVVSLDGLGITSVREWPVPFISLLPNKVYPRAGGGTQALGREEVSTRKGSTGFQTGSVRKVNLEGSWILAQHLDVAGFSHSFIAKKEVIESDVQIKEMMSTVTCLHSRRNSLWD